MSLTPHITSSLLTQLFLRDPGEFDTTQLKALKDFIPTDEEKGSLQAYMANATTEDARKSALANIQACEKYMITMMDVPNVSAKMECMLFKVQFEMRLEEIVDGIMTMTAACDEIRKSERLRKLMAIILTLGNQINTGGTGNMAAGFSLDALLKLDEVRGCWCREF